MLQEQKQHVHAVRDPNHAILIMSMRYNRTDSVSTPDTPAPPAPEFGREFDLLQDMTRTILEAAQALSTTLDGRVPARQTWQVVRDLEHKGDAIARELFETLLNPRGGPVDPQALKALTGYLDDVLDAIEAAAARLAIHKIRRAIPEAKEMGHIVLESAVEVQSGISALRSMHDVFPHTRTIHRLENRGDDLLREAIESLFEGRTSAKDIVKWKDICETLETSTDRCEDIANVLETVIVQAGTEGQLGAGRVVVDLERHEVVVAGEPVQTSTKEFNLLHLLLRHQGKAVRRERLLQEVWGEDYFGDSRTLDTHIGWLRKKVEGKGAVRITALRGIGYRLDLTE